ncbi:DegT/DnrJ/EryC1/StrS family aminotransferase [Roseibium sp.]|uniref:DegT/DnrJ/EryC1/StrS family aminotransferase n=1 Tax=Roseibium sp. TaxID=1936156 RepID=UPI003265FAB3
MSLADSRPHPDLTPLPFSVAFDGRDEEDLLNRWKKVLHSNRWSDGDQTREFEQLWGDVCGRDAIAFDNWSGGALAALDFIGVADETVLCPSNTFLATPRSAQKSGASVVYYDCNRTDLCGSAEDFIAKAERHRPKAAWIVHVGGHIAFDIDIITRYCRENGIWLLEDCAHAHGAEWNGRHAGSFGDLGVYSFYPTKTLSTGEGGMLVSANEDLIKHARSFRDYGRGSRYRIQGMNHRMHEFTAALGVVQTRRLADIVAWKNAYAREHLDPRFPNRVHMPDGMTSGYYKYIVFDPIERSTGKVYQEPCHRIFETNDELPNTDWIAANHWCVPIYYPEIQP